MDDHRLVTTDNPLYNGEFTPWNLWFHTDFTLSTLALRLEWLAWGEQPAGYHAVNLALHAFSCVLLWRLLRRLRIPGAWFAAALFALHPVCVNSLARIAEIKNTLSLPFFLLSLHAWLHYEEIAAAPARSAAAANPWRRVLWYQLAFWAFLLALFAKTSTIMLPPLLLGLALWQRRRLVVNDFLHTAPFFLLAAVMGYMSVWFQKHQALAEAGQTVAATSLLVRLANAGHVFWFYLHKAFVPVHLCFAYPVWPAPNPAQFAAWLPDAAIAGGFAMGWIFCRSWGRPLLLGLGGFALTLFPVLGLFDSQFLAHWQVSDHLVYLPLLFPLALFAASFVRFTPRWLRPLLAGAVLVSLFFLSHQRFQVFATEESLLRDTVAANPDAAEFQNSLGAVFARRHDLPHALEHFTRAGQLSPGDPLIEKNLGQALLLQHRFAEAEQHFRAGLRDHPDEPGLHESYATLLAQQGRFREAILQLQIAVIFQPAAPPAHLYNRLATLYRQVNQPRHAAAQLRRATQADPRDPENFNNLAWILATSADPRARDGVRAVDNARQACALAPAPSPVFLSTLAAAYAEAGRYDDAVATVRQAIQLQTAAGDDASADLNRKLLGCYQAGQPYHEPPQGPFESN